MKPLFSVPTMGIVFLQLMLLTTILAQERQTEARLIPVQYISAQNVYLKGGSDIGIKKGMVLRISRNTIIIGSVRVEYVAEHSASCSIISFTKAIQTNDKAILIVDVAPETPVGKARTEHIDSTVNKISFDSNTQTRRINTTRKRTKRTRISGSLSARYYQYRDDRSNLRDYSQPSFRVNVRGRQLWGKDYQFRIRTRARYLERSTSLNTDWQNRLYEASFSYDDPNSRLNYRFGRIISNHLSGVGYIDGAQIALRSSGNLQVGAFGGFQPDPALDKWGADVLKSGGFATYEKGDYKSNRLKVTIAAAGEYRNSEISREFFYLQSGFSKGRRLFLHTSAEVDLNRGWRKERTGRSLVLSSIFATGRIQLSESVNLSLQYDTRQNYWSSFNRSMEEALFEDILRQGYRGIVSVKLPFRVRLSANAGLRTAKDEENAQSAGARFYVPTFLIKRLSLSLSGAGFKRGTSSGYNNNAKLAFNIRSVHRLEVYYGQYAYRIADLTGQQLNDWIGVNLSLLFLRHLYMLGQFEQNMGSDRKGNTMSIEFGYRL
ncbi:MAG: hypothetical protein ACRBF0_24330 [Calditrichia bacterium]